MVTGVSSSTAAAQSALVEQSIQQSTPALSQSSVPQDTVTLSAAAQKSLTASVDVDHDGDSH